MAARKSMANKLLDNPIRTTSPSSSPLRRKSILMQKPVVLSSLGENDDEAERLARRREINVTSMPVSTTNTSDRRRSLGLSFLANMPSTQMAERISQCIKLGTENKINLKNAFSLEMIDFMTYMIKKQDVNMSNLQIASTSLDVSTKIYGFRVDGVHMDILKMVGGLDKQGKRNENIEDNGMEQMDTQAENKNNQVQKQERKKKRKCKQRIFATVEALRTNVETEKPSLITMEADLQTADMLYQAILPNHVTSRFYFHPYSDILVDAVEHKEIQDKDIGCDIPKIKDFSQMQICPPMFYFDFQSWNANDELENPKEEKSNEDAFQFDLDALLPEDNEYAGRTYFDVEENEEENVERFVAATNQVENIVDFREVLTTTLPSKTSEYTFIQKNLNIHWTGPSHWKITNFKRGNSKIIQMCCQAQNKKRKEIELHYDDEIVESIKAKFQPSQAVKMHTRTARNEWNEEILTLPPDEHYDIAQANKLYLHESIFASESTAKINTARLSDSIENCNYNCENDISNYCPETNDDQYKSSEENNTANNGNRLKDKSLMPSQPFTGDNLVAMPKLTNKVPITYCVRAKKVDMRQLKKSIWKCLNTNSEKQNESLDTIDTVLQNLSNKMSGCKQFSNVYKRLPTLLTKTNSEALSFPISFVSLLHLANEKSLKVISSLDMSDLTVEQD
ncbi:condensin complex subunit 2 [Nomia melanderi]|uniref:condensin complex subunit 2 n=1 Tax=Nomia melanderi TaxID=2448451 RepID=UPI0013042943|nr:condensin complex subunit 2-like [Nomia melanderi]XP_031842027.1 condensin complex subunit 2-like [Nomia melanderi]XP_031842028.1 condensin complex subunit 2-like [Nomia melanderi]XP_031842029.1 condensin complex subunit 2-like [Nomia melanderi]XP_031842030.1 condensin complex subunit 2-like [Nomia melanderi]XP_031842031.1 condensin complex subunit 2-like [Nomia melanderi]